MSLALRTAILSSFVLVNSVAFNAGSSLAFSASSSCKTAGSLTLSPPRLSGRLSQKGRSISAGQSMLRMGADDNNQDQTTKKTVISAH